MRSLNQVNLIGNVGNVSVTYSNSGMRICNVSLATNYKQDEKESVEWHNLVMFDKLADNADKYLTVGSRLFVSGRLKTEKWEDSNGVKREKTKVIVYDMIFLSFTSSASPSSSDGLKEMEQSSESAQQVEVSNEDIPF